MQNSEEIWRLVDKRKDVTRRFPTASGACPNSPIPSTAPAPSTPPCSSEGFRVTEKVAGIPTAVMGEAGEGGPVIAILGEYDALPGLSQEAGIAEQSRCPAGTAMAAATTCSAPPPCWRRRR